jgi:hypothetical protein
MRMSAGLSPVKVALSFELGLPLHQDCRLLSLSAVSNLAHRWLTFVSVAQRSEDLSPLHSLCGCEHGVVVVSVLCSICTPEAAAPAP